MPKGAKRRRLASRAVTHDEVAGYSETAVLFKSNLFKLQTAELLKEVSPFGDTPLTRLEGALRELRKELSSLPSAELAWERSGGHDTVVCSHPHLEHLSLHRESVRLAWAAPTKVELAGSYLLRTCAAPTLNVDVTIELPAGLFFEKDYLDARYVDKRLLYLTHLAHVLGARALGGGQDAGSTPKAKAKAKAKGSQPASVISAAKPPAFVALPHMQSTRWPALEIHLRDPAADSGDGGESGGAAEIGGWVVRLLPCLSADVFPPGKLRSPRCNLRTLGTRPSPTHNNLMRLESSYARTLVLLHSAYARDSSGSLREATILLKVWLRQRFEGQSNSPTGFQLSLLLLHLLATRKISLQMSSYHMLRVTLNYLRATDLPKTPIVLPYHETSARPTTKHKESDEDSEDDDEEEGETEGNGSDAAAARAAAAEEAVAAYRGYFPWVLTDASGTVNYGCGVSLGALRELSRLAAATLAAVDSHALSDSVSFSALFTERRPMCTKYDLVLHLTMPPADSPPPPGAGALPLPHISPEDPSDGADALAAASSTTGVDASELTCTGVAAVEGLIALGMGERVEMCRAWRPPLARWEPIGADENGAGRPMLVGMWLDAGKALQVVDRGPSPSNAAESKAWKALWGDHSETRRFKDGSIIHAVVWDVPNAVRHTSVLLAARALLGRHIGIAPSNVRASIGGCDDTLAGPTSEMGVSHTSSSMICRAFEKLSSTIRNLVRARCLPTLPAYSALRPCRLFQCTSRAPRSNLARVNSGGHIHLARLTFAALRYNRIVGYAT